MHPNVQLLSFLHACRKKLASDVHKRKNPNVQKFPDNPFPPSEYPKIKICNGNPPWSPGRSVPAGRAKNSTKSRPKSMQNSRKSKTVLEINKILLVGSCRYRGSARFDDLGTEKGRNMSFWPQDENIRGEAQNPSLN